MRPVTHGANWVQSARCPGATIRDSGRHIPSALRWILLVKPPRERPGPSPSCAPPPPAGPTRLCHGALRHPETLHQPPAAWTQVRAALIRPDGHVTWAAANSDGDNDSDRTPPWPPLRARCSPPHSTRRPARDHLQS